MTAAVAVGVRGGYTEAARGLTVVLAAVAIAVALARREAAVARAARTAPPLVLTALALIGALSAAWTVGAAGDALRWALVLTALAALMVAAAALPRPEDAAAVLLVVGAGAAATGLIGAIGHVDRIGQDICGSWRPAGPFEYPPALALACVSALPCAIAGMTRATGPRAVAFAAAGWLLVLTIVVSGTRLEVALGAAALVAAAALVPARDHAATPAVAAALLAVSGPIAAVIVGGDLGDDAAGATVCAGLAGLLVAAAWPALRARIGGARRAPWVVAVCVAGLLTVGASTAAERVGGCAYSGLAHGRSGIWRAAVHTARERPLAGHGLESFAAASRSRQLRERPVPVQYAHDLPLEAWVELGLAGVIGVLGLYGAVTLAALRATRAAAALLGPAALAFLAANLLDWPWHLAGSGALWAIAVGGLLGSRDDALLSRRSRT